MPHFCIFEAEIAEALGLKVQDGEAIQFGGIQKTANATAYLHEIYMLVGGKKHKLQVAFSYDIAKDGYGIVGQKGFFDIFTVKFDLKKEEIELKEKT